MPPFVPAIELCRALHDEAVRPILLRRFGGLAYAAALIGYGSDVLGFDDARSTDHQWGPRLLLFLSPEDHERHAAAIRAALGDELPFEIMGWSTHHGPTDEEGVARTAPAAGRPVNHRVEVLTLSGFFQRWLGFDPAAGVTARDWLLTPSQKLLSVTAGAVYHDENGALDAARARLAWYPPDVWLYLIACQWRRIAQEEAFVGRCAEAGDDLGSRIVAARLVRDLIKLCFLLERRYAPYGKWLGAAFARLDCADSLLPALHGALAAGRIEDRERCLSQAYEAVAALHNATGLSAPQDPHVRWYFGRPFRAISAGRFARDARGDRARSAERDWLARGRHRSVRRQHGRTQRAAPCPRARRGLRRIAIAAREGGKMAVRGGEHRQLRAKRPGPRLLSPPRATRPRRRAPGGGGCRRRPSRPAARTAPAP